MKKIKLSVAALLIAGVGYSQCNQICVDSINDVNYKNNISKFNMINIKIAHIISAVRMDMYYGRITQENGMYYVKELVALKSENDNLVVDLFRNRIDERTTRAEIYDCMNCDEMD